jgi:hypothetical protein
MEIWTNPLRDGIGRVDGQLLLLNLDYGAGDTELRPTLNLHNGPRDGFV